MLLSPQGTLLFSLLKLGPASQLYRLEELVLAVTQTFHQVALLLQPGVSEKGHSAKELKKREGVLSRHWGQG